LRLVAGRRPDRVDVEARAVAELIPDDDLGLAGLADGGGYDGPFAHRQGKPMRPDVALAFDRMAAAARREAGLYLSIASAYRSDAEPAVLWEANPDPRWVAPPGRSLHRYGTELDLGPESVYGWLAANSERFGFMKLQLGALALRVAVSTQIRPRTGQMRAANNPASGSHALLRAPRDGRPLQCSVSTVPAPDEGADRGCSRTASPSPHEQHSGP
jgi:D-alanyl-D-alanine carboxypeptidase